VKFSGRKGRMFRSQLFHGLKAVAFTVVPLTRDRYARGRESSGRDTSLWWKPDAVAEAEESPGFFAALGTLIAPRLHRALLKLF